MKSSVQQPLIFGTVFTNGKLVPIRAEIWSMFNKVQVVELVFITHLCSNFLSTLYLTFCRFITTSPSNVFYSNIYKNTYLMCL